MEEMSRVAEDALCLRGRTAVEGREDGWWVGARRTVNGGRQERQDSRQGRARESRHPLRFTRLVRLSSACLRSADRGLSCLLLPRRQTGPGGKCGRSERRGGKTQDRQPRASYWRRRANPTYIAIAAWSAHPPCSHPALPLSPSLGPLLFNASLRGTGPSFPLSHLVPVSGLAKPHQTRSEGLKGTRQGNGRAAARFQPYPISSIRLRWDRSHPRERRGPNPGRTAKQSRDPTATTPDDLTSPPFTSDLFAYLFSIYATPPFQPLPHCSPRLPHPCFPIEISFMRLPRRFPLLYDGGPVQSRPCKIFLAPRLHLFQCGRRQGRGAPCSSGPRGRVRTPNVE
ncbi:hypothetical protein CALCODRAFT_318947 [Calocera cornea HHB12733]|uniref:Uncharacterized protein n=1 Tax=Calocera cornea HHB12733 TaxID=1353952 RepID=A0A165F779_9BASI|nr:hypothetical protein CALCODRAFT_318947 [Calocera cornea HHB12733]